jgi:ribosomal protein L11 methyltransferase
MNHVPYYIELSAHAKGISPDDIDIATAFLSGYAFDSFDSNENVLRAFIKASEINPTLKGEIEALISLYVENIEWLEHPYENWNQKWEENYFQPIDIGSFHVRAPFHPASQKPHVITIEPRMSFGTGHHGTTRLMLSYLDQYAERIHNARVLDMGTGTGILAIAAEKLGAREVWGIEIDDWVVDNANDNLQVNTCSKTRVSLGTAALLTESYNSYYDVVIANIHREVILADLPAYCRVLKPGGLLFISGLQEADINAVDDKAASQFLKKDLHKSLDGWQGLVYIKPNS